MSALATIFSYWQNNTTLTAVLPYSSIYVGTQPESATMPFVVIVAKQSLPQFTLAKGYIEQFRFQIMIYGTDLDTIESNALIVMNQFDNVQLDTTVMTCIRDDYIPAIDDNNPRRVFHATLEYILWLKKSLP